MKIIKIKVCKECPYFKDKEKSSYHNRDEDTCVFGGIKTIVAVKIPKWCPLDDYKDK